jgi:hypothetical protein
VFIFNELMKGATRFKGSVRVLLVNVLVNEPLGDEVIGEALVREMDDLGEIVRRPVAWSPVLAEDALRNHVIQQ